VNITQRKEKFLLELMARIILSGGREVRPKELRNMTLGDVMDIVYPNMIELSSHTVDSIEFDLDEYDNDL
jgi:hypothetical protein